MNKLNDNVFNSKYYNEIMEFKQNLSENKDKIFNEAYESILLNDFKHAKKCFEEILQNEKDANAIMGKAYCYYQMGNIMHARNLSIIDNVDQLNVFSIKFYNTIYDTNIIAYDDEIPYNELLNSSYTLINRLKYGKAENNFNKILKTDSSNPNAIIGKIYIKFKKDEKFNDYESLDNLDLVNLNHNYLLLFEELREEKINLMVKNAFELLYDNKLSQAKKHFGEILKLNPGNNYAILGTAYYFYLIGKNKLSKELFNKINVIHLINPTSLKYYHILYAEYVNNPTLNYYYNEKGNMEHKKICPDCGRIVYDYAMRCVGCNHYFKENYSTTIYPYFKSEDIKKCLNELKKNNKLSNKAINALEKNDYLAANRYFQQILRINSKDTWAMLGKSLCLIHLKNFHQALKLCQNARSLNKQIIPDNYYNDLKNLQNYIKVPRGKKLCPNCGRIVNDYAIRCVRCYHNFDDN